MKKINMISMALLSSALVACGGGSGSPSKPDLCSELNVTNCDQVVIPSSASSSSISSLAPPVNNILPFTENFAVENATQLFSQAYKGLLNPGTSDLNPSFYYSTSGLDAGRIVASSGKMTIGNARFTLGQRQQTTGTHIDPAALPLDFKINTTTEGTAANFPTTTTWGELDLTNPWKISFCVRETEALSGSASNQQFMVYVDNNQSTSSFSLHGANSLVKQLNVTNFVAGKRVEINFPGDVFVDGKSIDTVLQNPGTTTSFIQLRVPSAGVLTMSELWVGYQANTSSEPAAATCGVGTRVPGWNIAPPPATPLAPTFESGNNQLRVNWPAAARATSYTLAYNTVNSLEGATLVGDDNADGIGEIAGTTALITGLTNGTSYFVFIKAHNTGGASAFGPSAVAVPEVPAVAPATPAALTVYGDNQRALVTWAATEGAENYALALNTMNETTTATVTTGLTSTYKRLTGLVNNTPYYVFVKAGNAVGESQYTAAQVVTPVASTYIYQPKLDITKDLFFGTNGPAVQTLAGDSEIPMHFIAGGGSGITLEAGGIRLASGGRFTIGQVVQANAEGVLQQVATTQNDTSVNGVLDLSGYYKIIINVVSAAEAGSLQLYLDNNTTSAGSSIHWTSTSTTRSRLLNRTAVSIADGEEIVIDVNADRRGTATSFIQLRVDSGVGTEGVLISGIRIEAADAPVGGSSSSEASSAPASSSAAPSSVAASSVAASDAGSSASAVASSSEPASSSAPTSSAVASSEPASSSAPASSAVASSSEPGSSAPASSSIASSSEVSSSIASSDSSSSTSSTSGGGTDPNFAWANFDSTTYASILDTSVTTNIPIIQSATPYSLNGLVFFHNATGTLRHRGGSNLEWNFNGTGWASGNPVAVVGNDADALRAYIAVPVDAGRAVTLTVVHRNSAAGSTNGKIVFIGSDNKVLSSVSAVANTATTTTFTLPLGHAQTHVKMTYSRDGATGGGMHFSSLDKTYN